VAKKEKRTLIAFSPSISQMAPTRPEPGLVACHTTFSLKGNCNVGKLTTISRQEARRRKREWKGGNTGILHL
jgi:hypothetical protein